MPVETRAALEAARFLSLRPTPEQIIAFHPSSEVAARVYDLIAAEKAGTISEAEQQELESFMAIEHLMELVKVEAHLHYPR